MFEIEQYSDALGEVEEGTVLPVAPTHFCTWVLQQNHLTLLPPSRTCLVTSLVVCAACNTITPIWCNVGFLRVRFSLYRPSDCDVGEAALTALLRSEGGVVAHTGALAAYQRSFVERLESVDGTFFSPGLAATQHEHFWTLSRNAC